VRPLRVMAGEMGGCLRKGRVLDAESEQGQGNASSGPFVIVVVVLCATSDDNEEAWGGR